MQVVAAKTHEEHPKRLVGVDAISGVSEMIVSRSLIDHSDKRQFACDILEATTEACKHRVTI